MMNKGRLITGIGNGAHVKQTTIPQKEVYHEDIKWQELSSNQICVCSLFLNMRAIQILVFGFLLGSCTTIPKAVQLPEPQPVRKVVHVHKEFKKLIPVPAADPSPVDCKIVDSIVKCKSED